jgi:hypothetical protein
VVLCTVELHGKHHIEIVKMGAMVSDASDFRRRVTTSRQASGSANSTVAPVARPVAEAKFDRSENNRNKSPGMPRCWVVSEAALPRRVDGNTRGAHALGATLRLLAESADRDYWITIMLL